MDARNIQKKVILNKERTEQILDYLFAFRFLLIINK